jgi:hypothetical protein
MAQSPPNSVLRDGNTKETTMVADRSLECANWMAIAAYPQMSRLSSVECHDF